MKTLLLVDLQNDFLPFGIKPYEGIDQLLNQLPILVKDFDTIIATQLWYPANHQRFAANHPWRHPGGEIELDGTIQVLHEFYTIQDTFGANLIASLTNLSIQQIFLRGSRADEDSHSVFYDKKDNSTGLLEYLKGKGITELSVLGVDILDTFEHSLVDAQKHNITVKIMT